VATKKKTVAKKPVTALAVRKPAPQSRQQIELVINDTRHLLPQPVAPPAYAPAAVLAVRPLGEEVVLVGLGTAELKLTAEEERTLNEPVLESEVLMKPTGQPYLSHPSYTRWFNRAFGRTGWALVPVTRPRINETTVVCEYMLYIHGQPVAHAIGEQEYRGVGSTAQKINHEQTYGDAMEATNASALRRVAKRLGVGLELWDKRWLHAFIDRYCIKVWKDGDTKPQWRRADDPPFYWENKQSPRQDRRPVEGRKPQASPGRKEFEFVEPLGAPDEELQPVSRSRAHPDQNGDALITDFTKNAEGKVGQVQRLKTILRKSGRDIDTVKAWMAVAYGYASSTEIRRRHYEEICRAIEGAGELPFPESGIIDVPREPEGLD